MESNNACHKPRSISHQITTAAWPASSDEIQPLLGDPVE